MAEITRKQIPNTAFDNMEFPPYEFREFPQAIPVVDGQVMPTPYDGRNKAHPVVIVESQEELDALMGPKVTLVPVSEAAPDGPKRLESEDDIKAALTQQAKHLGISLDQRWGPARMESFIQEHVAAKEAAKAEVV